MEGALLPLRHAYRFSMRRQVRAVQADWTADNPPYGAIMTYYLRDAAPAGTQWAIAISDSSGDEVRRVDVPGDAGVHRVAWDLTEAPPPPPAGAAAAPAFGRGGGRGGRGGRGDGPPVDEGRYSAVLGKMVNGTFTAVGSAQAFYVLPLPEGK